MFCGSNMVDILTCPRRPEQDIDQKYMWIAVNLSCHSEAITYQKIGFFVTDRVYDECHSNKVLYYMRKPRIC